MNCKLCKRELNTRSPLSIDIGGDCAQCTLEAKRSVGDYLAALNIAVKIINKYADSHEPFCGYKPL